MSDNKDNPITEPHTTSSADSKQKKAVVVSKENVVEVATTRSAKDYLLWLIAIASLICATLVSQYLPRYWAQGNNIWVQLGVTVGLAVFALLCLAFTNQGRAFKTLLKDAAIELRRVSWPSKSETVRYTWQVILVMFIVGLIIWLLDNLFNYLIGLII